MKTFGCFSIWAKFAGLEPTQVFTKQGGFLYLENSENMHRVYECWRRILKSQRKKLNFHKIVDAYARLYGKFCFHRKTLKTFRQHSSILIFCAYSLNNKEFMKRHQYWWVLGEGLKGFLLKTKFPIRLGTYMLFPMQSADFFSEVSKTSANTHQIGTYSRGA